MRTLSKIQAGIVVLAVVVTTPVVSYAADGKIKIGQTPSTTFPIVIDQSGSYVLTSNLQVSTNFNCIQISADNVTLDLNGFALVGPGSGSAGHGIYGGSSNNITVMNGTVRDFMGSGIYFLSDAHKIQLKDLKCTNNGQRGISVRYSTIVNCIAEDNGTDGILARYSTIRDCTSHNNTEDGIDVVYSTVLNCQIHSNDNRGIYSRQSTITSCTISGSGSHGIEAFDSTLNNCTSYGHSTFATMGIYLTDSIANSCAGNANSTGFRATNSILTNCTANMNDNDGFYYVQNSILTNCKANGNGGYGFRIEDFSIVTNCTANNNGHTGMNVQETSRIEGNNVRNNGGNGIHLRSTGRDNYVIKNTASDHVINFNHGGTNNYMPLTGDNANHSFTSP